MNTIDEIRLENLRALIKEKGSQKKVSDDTGTSQVYLSQLLNAAKDAKTGKARQIGDDMARKLEIGCGKVRGWLDNVHSTRPNLEYQQDSPTIAVAAEPNVVYTIKAAPDLHTERLTQLWNELDVSSKTELLNMIEFFVAGRRPHRDGQAHTVAGY
jgi:hypothetical protein